LYIFLPKYGDYDYPDWADIIGIGLTLFITMQIPIWALFAILRQKKGDTWTEVSHDIGEK
jgi:hypothetical protein